MRLKLSKIIILSSLLLVTIIPAISLAETEAGPGNKYCYTVTITDEAIIGSSERSGQAVCSDTLERCEAGRKRATYSITQGLRWIALNFGIGYQNIVNDKYISPACVLSIGGETNPNIANWSEKIDEPKPVCALSTDFSLVACFKVALSWGVSVFLWLLSWILFFAGQLLNVSVKLSILDFNLLAKHSAVTAIWGMGRDLANIFFIFILIYIAIATIIQKTSGNVKTLVVKVIITALLINFSMIIPKVVIDIGNSLANVFYQNMGSQYAGAPDIAGTLVRGIKPQQFFQGELQGLSTNGTSQPSTSAEGSWKAGQDLSFSTIVTKGLGTGILIIILSYALFVAAYMFLARTVVLIFLIATSSLAFFSRIVPIGKLNYWSKWLDALWKEVFFAPYFMFAFYLVLKIASTPMPNFSSGTTSTQTGATSLLADTAATAGAGGGTNLIMGVIWYVFICGLALGSLKIARTAGNLTSAVAKSLGAKAADKWVVGGAQGAVRNSVGRVADSAANSKFMKGAVAKNPIVGGALRSTLNKVGSAKFGGTQSYQDAQKARADKLKAQMEGMGAEQKAKYIENLRTGKIANILGLNDRDILYKKGLSDEERNKIEGAAIGASKAEAEARGNEAYAKARSEGFTVERAKELQEEAKNKYIADQTRFITEQRSKLKGEEKTKTYTQKIKGEKNAERKLEILKELTDEKEIKEVIKGLDEQTLAKIRISPSFGGLAAGNIYKDSLENRVSDLDVDATEKLGKAEKAEKEKVESSKRKTEIEQLQKYIDGTTPIPTGLSIPDEVKALKKGSLKQMNKKAVNTIAGNADTLKEMSVNQLIELAQHNDLDDRDGLFQKLQTMVKTPSLYGLNPEQHDKLSMITTKDTLINKLLID